MIARQPIALLSRTSDRRRSAVRRLVESLELRRLLCGDHPWHASEDGGVTMDAMGNIVDLSLSPASSTVELAGRGSGDYNTTTPWGSSTVTFGFSNLLDGGLTLGTGTTTNDLRQMIYDALGLWTAVSGLTLIYQADPANPVAVNDNGYTATGYPQIRVGHHDIAEPGSGLNTLAHCGYPGGNGRDGDMHFDDTDTWGNGIGTGIDFLETATHELGHGIGIMHANGDATDSCPTPKPAIMDACIQNRFNGRDTAYLLLDDVNAVQSLYGSGLGYVRGQDGIARVYGMGESPNLAGGNLMTVNAIYNVPLVGNCYQVVSTYGSTLIPTSTINGLIIEGMGGDDFLRVDSAFAGVPITLRGGNGNDTFDFGFGNPNLGAIQAAVSIEGGDGDDRVWTYDDNTTTPQTYTVTSSRFDRGGWGGFFYNSAVEGLFLRTGQGADIVNVNSTFNGQPVTLNSKAGNDIVNVGTAAAGVTNIRADLQINNSPAYSTVNINNGADTTARNWLVNDASAGYGAIAALATGNIVWKNSDIDAVNLITGSGNDVGNIARLSVTLNINNVGSGNLDQITVGNASAGGLASIFNGRQGGLTIDNDPAFTRLTIDDNGSSVARTASLDIIGGYNVLTGLAPATIRFDDNDLQEVTIRSGGGADTINVARYHAANTSANTLTINSTAGNDTVNLGNLTDGVRSITAPIVVRNTPARTTLNISNNADTVGRTVGIDYSAATELQTITGLAVAAISYRVGDIDLTNGVTITNGSGIDNYLLVANAAKLNLTTVSSGDNIAIGPNLSRITAEIYSRNPNSLSNVSISDTSSAVGRNYWLSTTTIGSEYFQAIALNGLLSTSIYLKAVDTRPVTLYGGSGDDTFTLMSTAISSDIQGNNGADTLNYGGNLAGLRKTDAIFGSVAFAGGVGSDVISVNDVDYAAAGGVVNVNTAAITSNHAATLTFSDVARVAVSFSTLGETLNVMDTLSTFLVDAIGGTAKDVVNVARTAAGSYVRLSPSGGFDDVTVDSTGTAPNAGLQLNGNVFDLGALTINNAGVVAQATGTASTRVKTLSFTGNGGFDLGNGSLVVDYTGGTQLSNVRTNILKGYNAGAWNGGAIYSTYAGSHPGYAIGYAEATAIRTLFPATFEAFSNVDNTSILIRSTLLGDANLDKSVNFDDLLRVSQNYHPTATGRIWTTGDFNFDGRTNFDDLLVLAQRYGLSFSVDWATAQQAAKQTPALAMRRRASEMVFS